MGRKSKSILDDKEEILWNVAVYIRLSVEDGDDKLESNSITNQRELINLFLNNTDNITIYDYYIDDGYSGTDFNRPGFKKMLEDMKNKKINAIIVKDLSRLGRNYIEVGNYIEQIFPLYRVRFIAINDNVDSYKDPKSANNIMIPFKNLMNDEYCRDISNKVKSVLNAKKKSGQFCGSVPPYGYVRNKRDKHILEVDNESASVVKKIFELALDGVGKKNIVVTLNNLGIYSPTIYKRKILNIKCGNGFTKNGNEENDKWTESQVTRILKNEMYCGDMIQGKRKTISYKVHKQINVDNQNWLIVRNTHEAIIDRETFDKVQDKLFSRDMRVKSDGNLSIFSGHLKCNDCNNGMTRKKSKCKELENRGKERYIYYCNTYVRKSHELCSKHKIRSDDLERAVLESIKLQIKLVIEIDNIIQEISNSANLNYDKVLINNNIKKCEEEIEKARVMKKELYEDWKLNVITKEDYIEYSKDYDDDLNRLLSNFENLKLKQKALNKKNDNKKNWITEFKKNQNITELNKNVIDDLINYINVHEDGKITIDFKYQDEYNQALKFVEEYKNII